MKGISALLIAGLVAVSSLLRGAEEVWSASDTQLNNQAYALFDEEKYAEAEEVFQRLADAHPTWVTTRIGHIRALDSLERYPEALAESRQAVALDPQHDTAQFCLGRALCRKGDLAGAVTHLLESDRLTPHEPETLAWLIAAYARLDQPEKIAQINREEEADARAEQANRAQSLGWECYQADQIVPAVEWWKKAARLGHSYSARLVAWAYKGAQGFPADEREVQRWESRAAYNGNPALWRLPFADFLIEETGGWGSAIVALSLALFLTWATLQILYRVCQYVLKNLEAEHWSERARRSYPWRRALLIPLCLFPVVVGVLVIGQAPSLFPFSPVYLGIFTGLIVACFGIGLARKFAPLFGLCETSGRVVFGNSFFILYFYFFILFLFGILFFFLDPEHPLRSGLALAAFFIFYIWFQYRGVVSLGRVFQFMQPAPLTLAEGMRAVAQTCHRPIPAVFLLSYSKPYAFALPFAQAIGVTPSLIELNSPEELRSILSHELAHLHEDRGTRIIRFITPLLLLPLFCIPLWFETLGLFGLVGFYFLLFLGFRISNRRARQMETGADAHAAENSQPAIYAQALAKLYEANLLPAVMPGQRHIHPHLYDRMLSAGLTPDFPRPAAPNHWISLIGLIFLAIAGGIYGLFWQFLY